MNKITRVSALGLGMTYAGCFFGAGYISGKELYEFFGSFGTKGFLGVLLSIFLFFIFGSILIRNVQLSGKSSFDEAIIMGNFPKLRILLGFVTVFIMFGILVVMAAGAGALINQVFDLPHFVGCAIFSLLVCLAAMFGISGAVKVFSTMVPILVMITLVICGITISKYGINLDYPSTNTNPLISNWWFSAITYVSYNIITLIGTIIPVGVFIKKKSTVYGGILLGCIFALSIATGILLAVTSVFSSVAAELPMLEIAFRLNDVFGYIYAILLLMAMFGTSLASLVAIIIYLEERSVKFSEKKNIYIYLLGIAAFLFSLAGFGNLVNTVYPLFGYVGFVILAFILGNFIYLKLKK